MTTLRMERYELPAADVGPENPLPVFRDAKEDAEVALDANVPEEDRRYMGWRIAYRVLPYRMQDGYTRKKERRALKSIVLENAHLRATFLPDLGGRLVSLLNKKDGRDLLERNPVFQPANLALRNAWFSGGIEWNTSLTGHYYLTCSPVFAARVVGVDGEPVLRLYEWDRVKCFPWQIDFHLPSDSPFLYARVRLINPHERELPMYWWTNIAVDEQPGARVLFPADTAIGSCGASGLGRMQLPTLNGADVSYPTNVPFAREMFARIEPGQRRWVAHLDAQGKGMFETSTDRLGGRKMFCWGMNPGGRRWQEFLSAPGHAYLEIQAGLARTQLECLPMPARSEWTWTEAFGPVHAAPAQVHSTNWDEAWRTVDTEIETVLPRARVADLEDAFGNVADRPAEEILSLGSGWGALERVRIKRTARADTIPASLLFETLKEDQMPWVALLDLGALPECDPSNDPGQTIVQPEWRNLLEEAVRSGRGDHWLSWYHLGIMRMEALDATGAREAWETSVKRRPSGWALRNLAVIEQRAGNKNAERELLCRAWEAGPKIPALALEYAAALMEARDYEALAVFLDGAPEPVRAHERMRILSARAALEQGDLGEVERLFDAELATNREGEVTLTDLWFGLHEKRLEAKEGVPIDDALRKRVRREFPPPHSIDFRMSTDAENSTNSASEHS